MVRIAHLATAFVVLSMVFLPWAAAACSQTASCGNACESAPPCHTTGGVSGDPDCCSATSGKTPALSAPAACQAMVAKTPAPTAGTVGDAAPPSPRFLATADALALPRALDRCTLFSSLLI